MLDLNFMVFNSFQNLVQPSLPATLEAILDTLMVPIPTATLRAIAAAALRDRDVTPQGLGRIAAYEEESFRRRRGGAPRFSWVLDANGVALSPRIWARGSWRLSRRVLTEDAVGNWNVTMALFLAGQMSAGDQQTRKILGKVAQEMTSRVLGPLAVYGQGNREDWRDLRVKLAAHQHPLGPEAPTREQNAAAARLEDRDLTPYATFFGVDEVVPEPDTELPARLRLARPGEGLPFDRLVMRKAGDDSTLGREVLAYVQEWGWLVDSLGRSPTLKEYAERWQTDLSTVRARNDQFASLFPAEETPERIWNLLWSGEQVRQSFVRLIGREVVEDDLSPSVINRFVNALAFELKDEPRLGAQVYGQIAAFEESGPLNPGRELRRFFALAERTRIWSAHALVAAGESVQAQGLLSIESVIEERSAAYAEREIGKHRRQMPEGAPRDLLRCAQKALRVAATLDAMNPPISTLPYLEGVEWAAKALALVRNPELNGMNLEGEARATVRAIEVVH